MDGEADWEEIFGEHQSTVDWPGSFFYRQLADRYPDAKVVLSTRDPEAWEKSMRDTIWELFNGDSLMTHLSRARAVVDPDWRAYVLLMQRMWAAAGHVHARSPGARTSGRARSPATRNGSSATSRAIGCSFGALPRGGSRFASSSKSACPIHRSHGSTTRTMFIDRVVDGSLIVLQEWRARDGAAEAAAHQPA